MFIPRKRNTNGFSIIETIVAVAIFAGVSFALFSSFKQAMKIANKASVRSVMSNIATEQLEIIRNLPFDNVGTISGIPSGVIPQNKVINRAGSTYSINTTIRNIDLPFDGVAPADTAPADNKFAQVDITCTSCSPNITASYSTQIGPKDLEGSSTNGSLFVRTIDAKGEPVPNAVVKVKVNPPNPIVDLIDSTGLSGILQLVGATPLKNAYQVSVSKPGYTSDMTYSPNGPTTTNPVLPHATVDPGVVTQLTFVIDKVSNVNVSSLTPTCAAVPNTVFQLTGDKKIGYEPIYKYDKSLTTDTNGLYSIPDMEWDTYKVKASKTGYNLIGVIPSPQFIVTPGTTQSLSLIMLPDGGGGQNNNTIVVSIKDGLTGAQLSGVNVSYVHSQETIEKVTGRGQMIQTDWSLGSGYNMYEEPAAYESDDGNISVTDEVGAVKLKNTGSYAPSGMLLSSIIDTGTPSNFYEFRYSPITKPDGTNIEFQLATSNATSGPWIFLGPDGTASTTYSFSNSIINAIHNGDRYLRYKMMLSTSNTSVTPTVEDVTFSYTSGCFPPGQTYAQSIHNGSWEITMSKDGYETLSEKVSVNGEKVWLQLNYMLDPI